MTDASPVASPTADVTVIIAVPNGSVRPGALVDAVVALHPDWHVVAVWSGDPQLRPSDCVEWLPAGHAEIELARIEPDALPLFAALGALDQLPPDRSAIVLTAGSIGVLGALDGLVPGADELVVVPRVLLPPTVHDRHPQLVDLAEAGLFSSSVLAIGSAARGVARWMRAQLLAADPVGVGPLLDLAGQLFRTRRCSDPRVGVSVWRWDADDPTLVEATGYDPERPWLLDPSLDGPPLVSLSTADRIRAMRQVAPQLAGSVQPLCLPGGLEVDDVVRAIVRAHPDCELRPWHDAGAFRRWVAERYWTTLLDRRPDVSAAFPSPSGIDADRFAAWARHAAFDGRAPLMVDPSAATGASAVVRTGDRLDGVNLIGYFRHQSGVANVGRRLAAILDRHDIPYTTVAYERTESPLLSPPPTCDQHLEFATSLVFVNGDQFAMFRHDLPDVYGPDRRVIGLWSWELESFDGAAPVGDDHVDEVWATTTFMARPVEALGTVPVRVVSIPFSEPEPSDRSRRQFAPLADTGDRFVFGVVLDHLSITARKNPIAAIRAFRQAFDPRDGSRNGPLLLVKTINAERCWQEHEQLLTEAVGRDDIVIWDEHLTRADHLALIRSFDAMVSLHRSEGVGLHLTEAMWMQIPIIATRYSGNLDFMDDSSAVLIDAELVAVGDDGGWAYPATARWAAPDLDQAAAAMRRLIADPVRTAEIGTGARARMLAEPSESEFAARLRELLRLP